MKFAFTDDQLELKKIARKFLDNHSTSKSIHAVMKTELGYDPDVWKRIAQELGWTALHIPEAYGGVGFSYVELVAVIEEMGRTLLCSPFFSSICLGANAILQAGSEGQKLDYLPSIAGGELQATLAFTEKTGRWDAGAVVATATRDGNEYVLNGTKHFVIDGHAAALLIIAVRAPGTQAENGISLFAVPAETAGIERVYAPTMDQTRKQAEIRLSNVRVPITTRLGDEGCAWPALEKTLDLAAIALAAEQVGGMQMCLDMAVDYAKVRVQFNRPIGSFQAIKHKCADMLLQVESARSAAYYAGFIASQNTPELAETASIAKSYCSDAFFRCASENIQIHGGIGFTWEHDAHLYFKRAQASKHLLGDAAYHRERFAKKLAI